MSVPIGWYPRLAYGTDAECSNFEISGAGYGVLARLALLNRNEDFFSLLPDVLASRKLTIENLIEWPIFREMREDPEFDVFVQSHSAESEGQGEDGDELVH